MPINMPDKDFRTKGYILKRVNYGEADRILNIITPVGKIVAIAKGVRREKSKLAGAIELFSLTDFNFHQGRSEFLVITGAKMIRHYGEIVKNFDLLNTGALVLKFINKYAENSDNPEFFSMTDQIFKALDKKKDLNLIRAWFLMNLMKNNGEEMNLYRDRDGKKLVAEKQYAWDEMEENFFECNNGEYGSDEIKMLRLLSASDLNTVMRIKTNEEVKLKIFSLVQRVSGIREI